MNHPAPAFTTCLVTGAASGIGAATARWLAGNGAQRLLLVDRDEKRMAALDLPCRVDLFAGDVADEVLWHRIEQAGPIDAAVLNAGLSDAGSIAELELAAWRRIMATNLDGLMLSLRCAMRLMQASGGAIVVTASVGGMKAEPGTAAYGASKAAAIQLAKVAAKEGAPHAIRVNAIAPGGVDTPIWDTMPFFEEMVATRAGNRDAAIADLAKMATPLGRYASADEIAAQIGFLLSPAAATITGAVLVSDGGYSL